MTSASLDVAALRQLVAEARGERIAGDRLIREHDAWIRSVIYGVTGRSDLVDDIAQQVWTQVWERIDTLVDPARLRSWLYAIARHAAIDYGVAERRRSRTVAGADGVLEISPDERGATPAQRAQRDEVRAVLMDAVTALPAIYREPFVLRHLEDWSYAEIGETLGMPVETVETRLVRARRLLRALKGRLDE